MADLTLFGGYEVLRHLAAGGMGDIYLARQRGVGGFDRLVVLKTLRPEVANRDDVVTSFLHEGRVSAAINHPNVVVIYEVGQVDGVYFIAMEYVRGADLFEIVAAAKKKSAPLSPLFAASVIREAALGLFAAHQGGHSREGVVHRDISPENVMVRQDGLVKVVDFGVAATIDKLGGGKRKRLEGKIRYMAPEQISGDALDGRADQFALGVVFWELLTEKRLFQSRDPAEIYRSIMRGDIPSPSRVARSLDRRIDEVVARMLRPSRDERFATCSDLASAIDEILQKQGESDPDGLRRRVIEQLVGDQIAAKASDMAVGEVSIAGRVEESTLACPVCLWANAASNKFCAECGAALQEFEPAAVVELSRSTTRSEDLLGAARGLEALALVESKRTVALSFSISAEFPENVDERRDLRERLIHSMSRLAIAYEAQVSTLTSEAGLFTLASRGAERMDVLRAVELARELEERVRKLLDGQPQWFCSVELGHADAVREGVGRTKLSGGPISSASEYVLRLRNTATPGLFLGPDAREAVHGSVRFELVQGVEPQRKVIEVLVRTPKSGAFVGRTKELNLAQRTLGALWSPKGAPHALFVGGPGAGKSRLLVEIEALARKRGIVPVFVSADDLIADGDAVFRQRLISGIKTAAGNFGELQAWLDFAEKKASEPALGALQERRAARAALMRCLLRASNRTPICLLLDDIDRMSPQVRRFVERLTTDRTRGRVGIIAGSTAPDALGLPSHVLGELDDDQVQGLAESALGGRLPPLLSLELLSHAEGSPGLASLYCEWLLSSGAATPSGSTLVMNESAESMEWPSAAELPMARIAQLSRPARAFVLTSSVFGPMFTPKSALDLAGGFDDPKPVVRESLKCGLMARARFDDRKIGFDKPSIRRALSAQIPEDKRGALERKAARALLLANESVPYAASLLVKGSEADRRDALEAVAPMGVQPVLATVARAFLDARRSKEDRAREIQLLSESTRRAALEALAEFDPDAAEEWVEVILEAQPSSWDAYDALGVRVQLRKTKLDEAGAEADAMSRVALLEELADDKLMSAKDAVEILVQAPDEDRFQRARESIEELADARTRGELWFRLGGIAATAFRDLPESKRLQELAERESSKAGDNAFATRARLAAAAIAGMQGQADLALSELEAVVDVAATSVLPIVLATAQFDRGRALIELGRFLEAQKVLQEARDLFGDLDQMDRVDLTTRALEWIERNTPRKPERSTDKT